MTVKNDYYLYRRKIRSGDLLVWDKGSGGVFTGLILFFIKLFTLSEYVHVGVAWKTAGRLFVIEASLLGVRITPLSKKKSFYHVPMNLTWTKAHDCFLLDKIGHSYSIKDAIKGYFGTITPGEDDRWQCAELATVFYKHVGLDFGKSYTPAKLVKSVLADGYNMVYVTIGNDK